MLNGFIEIANKSKHKPHILWFDQGNEFYNNHIPKWLDDHDILMYSTQHVSQ